MSEPSCYTYDSLPSITNEQLAANADMTTASDLFPYFFLYLFKPLCLGQTYYQFRVLLLRWSLCSNRTIAAGGGMTHQQQHREESKRVRREEERGR